MPIAHSQRDHKLVQNSFHHQKILYQTNATSASARLPSIRLRFLVVVSIRRPLQMTSVLVPQSPFRDQFQTIGKSLPHAEDVKSAASSTRK
jgi:hypothetical protein